ncbi:unnamed protein product [Lactuca virosa]|uniref:Uncharacterized protein n=1 Tax=Lactuca virosa TaxID=75947 RepID=A0AAU9LTR2_9ASTR|nr:unnamed protein product [Lactuca virosa]
MLCSFLIRLKWSIGAPIYQPHLQVLLQPNFSQIKAIELKVDLLKIWNQSRYGIQAWKSFNSLWVEEPHLLLLHFKLKGKLCLR